MATIITPDYTITQDSIRVPYTQAGADTTHVEYTIRHYKAGKAIRLYVSHKKFDEYGSTYMPMDSCNFSTKIQSIGRKSQKKLDTVLQNVIDNIDTIHALAISGQHQEVANMADTLKA